MIALQCVLAAQAVFGQIEPLEELEPLELVAPAPAETAPAQPNVAPNFEPGMTLYIDATSLALRSGPTKDAGLIHYIPQHDSVKMLKDVLPPVPMEIGDKKGQWAYVQHGQHKGYVFDAYLSDRRPPLEETLDWISVPGERVGPVTSKTTYGDLAQIVGAENLAGARISIGDEKYEEGTSVFPGDKERELIIQWAVPNVRAKAVFVNGTKWKTQSGLGIGTPLSKIIEVNQAPVSFAGFEWEYAGYITSWRAGTLDKTHTLRKSFTAFLAPEEPYLPEHYQALLGDQEYSSELPEAAGLNLKISSMTVIIAE